MPRVLVFAGPNGSGKSTVTKMLPTTEEHVNADEIEKYLGCTSLEAAQNAEKAREALSSAGGFFL